MRFNKIFGKRVAMMGSLVLGVISVFAQKDTIVDPKVTIISSYKPTVVSPEKLLFTATPSPVDSVVRVRPYNVPLQTLVYAYQSAQLHPLAIQTEDETPLRKSSYFLKAGYGNLSSPLVSARATISGMPSTLLNATFNYWSAKGTMPHQDVRLLDGSLAAAYFLPASELHGKVSTSMNKVYLYGYDQALIKTEPTNIGHAFNTVETEVGYRNTETNQWGIDYHPVIQYRRFSLKDSLYENTFAGSLPVNFTILDQWKGKFWASTAQTAIQQKRLDGTDTTTQNNLYQLKPEVIYTAPKYTAGAGLLFANDRGKWIFMPHLSFSMPLRDTSLMLQAGVRSEVHQNTYQYMAAQNPFVLSQIQPTNGRSIEYYVGANAFLGKFVQVHGQLSMIRARQFAFFVNDTSAPANAHLYKVQLEDRLNIFRAQLQMSYAFQDLINVSAGVIFNGYSGMQTNQKAWNVLPMEINATASYKYRQHWTFKGTWWLFSGSYYPVSGGKENKFEGGNDLSMEANYSLRKNLSAFLSINNIFGKSYQRWYRYPVYGINAMAGLQLRF